MRFKTFLIVSMIVLGTSLVSGCEKLVKVNASAGIPRQIYDPVPLYSGPVDSIGTLTEAYITNTEGLITANSRLNTLCVAFEQCKKEQE